MTTPNSEPSDTRVASAEEQPADAAETAFHTSRLLAYRDDGPIAHALGRLTRGQLPPLLPVLVAAIVTLILLIAGVEDQGGLALLAPVLVLLLAGPGSAHPHTGRLDWAAPNIIRVIEYGYLATLGFSHGVSKPLVYALLGVLAYHHYDTAYRTRQRLWPAAWVFRAGLGWDGRMLIAGLGALTRTAPLVYAVLTGYLGVLFAAESIYSWSRTSRRTGVMVNLEEPEGEAADAAPATTGGSRTGHDGGTR
jgi:hypothetical protein